MRKRSFLATKGQQKDISKIFDPFLLEILRSEALQPLCIHSENVKFKSPVAASKKTLADKNTCCYKVLNSAIITLRPDS